MPESLRSAHGSAFVPGVVLALALTLVSAFMPGSDDNVFVGVSAGVDVVTFEMALLVEHGMYKESCCACMASLDSRRHCFAI